MDTQTVIESLVSDISRGPIKTWDSDKPRIVASSAQRKYGCWHISDSILREVAKRLNLDYIEQYHVYYSDADRSYTWLKLGMPIAEKISKLKTEIARLEEEY